MVVRSSTELAPFIRQDGIYPCLLGLEKRQHRFIEHMNRGYRQLAGVEPSPGVAAIAVQHGLQIHLANPLERTDEEGVDRHQFPGVVDLNLAFAKLGAEAFEQANLLGIELHGLLPLRFFEAQQVGRVWRASRGVATHPTGTDVDTLQSQFFLCDPVGIRPFTAGQFVELALGAIGLVITANFVELLTAVADELAGFADVIELFGEL